MKPIVAVIASISIVITASYIIRIIGKVFFGQMSEEFSLHIGDVNALDKLALTLLCIIMIIIGIYPSIMSGMVSSGVDQILRLFGGV
jgi:NADH-quinone oxidoreductase subunit M